MHFSQKWITILPLPESSNDHVSAKRGHCSFVLQILFFFRISNKSCKSDVGQHCHRKVDESIYQTSQFGTLLREPWTLFGSTLSTLDLSWNSLCPLGDALLGNRPIWTHAGRKKDSLLGIILIQRPTKVTRNLNE